MAAAIDGEGRARQPGVGVEPDGGVFPHHVLAELELHVLPHPHRRQDLLQLPVGHGEVAEDLVFQIRQDTPDAAQFRDGALRFEHRAAVAPQRGSAHRPCARR